MSASDAKQETLRMVIMGPPGAGNNNNKSKLYRD
jgi:hypothetical protein